MAIVIPHRFSDRLLPNSGTGFIKTIIIGTFNPGIPKSELLTASEIQKFERIYTSKKFQKFNEVRNFYDRPQNRFWKVMDTFHNPAFYSGRDLKARNPTGLKYYRNLDRAIIFENQMQFCASQGIFITDIVKQIEPSSFNNIYDNFPDKGIESSKCDWNTKDILRVIQKFAPQKILINFSQNKSIPRISAQIDEIKTCYPNKTFNVLSTSGAAGNDYRVLCQHWHSLI